MKRVLQFVLILLIVAPLMALMLVWLSFQNAPLTTRQAGISYSDIEQAKFIIRSHDPRKLSSGALRTIMLSQHEMDLVLNYAANRFRLAASQVELKPGMAQVQVSLETLDNPFGQWLNIDAMLLETGNLPEFEHLTIGRVHVPAFIANFFLARLIGYLNDGGDGVDVSDVVKKVMLVEDGLQVVYAWRDDLPDRLRTVLLPEIDQERMKIYSDHLVEVIAHMTKTTRRISLPQLLQPMFAFARQRSVNGDAGKENRAALITLAFYANGRGLTALIPAARNWAQPEPMWVTLGGRYDTPKHYVISAAIAAEAGSPLADAIGLYKEVNDARGGTGFSFNDLAADRAGTRMGEIAAQEPRKLQARFAIGVQESDLMPHADDLPEFMQEAEFKQRFGGVGTPAYNRILTEIDARIAAIPIFKE